MCVLSNLVKSELLPVAVWSDEEWFCTLWWPIVDANSDDCWSNAVTSWCCHVDQVRSRSTVADQDLSCRYLSSCRVNRKQIYPSVKQSQVSRQRGSTKTATNHDGHKIDHDGHSNDGHKTWRPQTITMTATPMTATNHDGHKPWPWRPHQWRPQTMTATNHHHDGHTNDGHKPWRPQTITMTATTMTAKNMTMDFVAGVWILLVLHSRWPVCGRHGIGSPPTYPPFIDVVTCK